MADIATHFPPQTYSSSFFLNSIVEDGTSTIDNNKKDNEDEKTNGPLLDCFISRLLSGEKRRLKHKSNNVKFIRKSPEKELDVANDDIWKKNVKRPDSPHNAFRRWRKSAGLKLSESTKSLTNTPKLSIDNNKTNDEEMSLLKFLAINALDLSAPASDILLKSRSSNWFQLSGHPDSLAPAGPGTVWKKRANGTDDTERIVYEELSNDPHLCDIIPQYYREVDYQGEKFIELQDLLHGFQDPYVVDIKMGTRTFLESEVKKTTPRPDLYQKMIAIDPNAPTQEEHEKKAVTKLRYMQFRELQSSTCSHGFRIEAMKCRGSPPVTDLKTVKSNEEIFKTLNMFINGCEDTRQRLLRRLCEMRNKIEESEFFKTHEVVGASIFIIYDDNKVGVWLIDFAKTNKLPEGMSVNHREHWFQGNHEEGFLFGFDNLITVIENMNMPSLRMSSDTTPTFPTVSVKS